MCGLRNIAILFDAKHCVKRWIIFFCSGIIFIQSTGYIFIGHPKMSDTPSPKLLDQVRGKIRLKHYSICTEQTYTDWIKCFILFHGKRHPKELGPQDVESFLTPFFCHASVAERL